jgi:hypothetical protein
VAVRGFNHLGLEFSLKEERKEKRASRGSIRRERERYEISRNLAVNHSLPYLK